MWRIASKKSPTAEVLPRRLVEFKDRFLASFISSILLTSFSVKNNDAKIKNNLFRRAYVSTTCLKMIMQHEQFCCRKTEAEFGNGLFLVFQTQTQNVFIVTIK